MSEYQIQVKSTYGEWEKSAYNYDPETRTLAELWKVCDARESRSVSGLSYRVAVSDFSWSEAPRPTQEWEDGKAYIHKGSGSEYIVSAVDESGFAILLARSGARFMVTPSERDRYTEA